jgi:enoyl-CoA hydratase/carnithine racemase
MGNDLVAIERHGRFATITMDNPERRNALSRAMVRRLTAAFQAVGESSVEGVILAGTGPVFSAGHDFSEMLGIDLATAREIFSDCTTLMRTIQSIPQPVVARVHALATAAGCQLVATCDMAVAADGAGFAIPGGKGGLFCHTPLVALVRAIGRKRALEMAFTGDVIEADLAEAWGLVNRTVAPADLDATILDLLERSTRGSTLSRGLGKHAFYAQVDLEQEQAYAVAVEVMAAAAVSADAQEGIAAFVEHRKAVYPAPVPAAKAELSGEAPDGTAPDGLIAADEG